MISTFKGAQKFYVDFTLACRGRPVLRLWALPPAVMFSESYGSFSMW